MITGLWLLLDRDARSRAAALRVLFGYNTRSNVLKMIERSFGHEPAFWPISYPGPHTWDRGRFFEDLYASRRPKLDPDKKAR